MGKVRKPAGIILSAGFSSRMKDFKPLMKIGKKNSLEILINSMEVAGIEDIYIVVGYNADIISEFLADKNVKVILNERFEEGMFTSIKKGVSAAGDHDCFVITPVDIPLIPPYIIKAVLDKFYEDTDSFVVPCFDDKKGHPLCVSSVYADEIIGYEGENGLKAVRDNHKDKLITFDTNCEGIILDMDTPKAYKHLIEYYEQNKYPDEEKCLKILDKMETPAHVVNHCKAVTKTAVAITEALNEKGCNLSVPLVRAAGLLHDVLRVKKKHWEAGANLMIDYGYPEVAEIIYDHMNFMHSLPVFEVDEKDIICLSDKLRQEVKLVTLDERLEPVRVRWADNKEALEVIEKRIQCAEAVMKYIENVIGCSIFDLLEEADDKEKMQNPEIEDKKRRLVLIRHGETQKHKEKIFLGQTDVPLNVEGKEQCTHVGIELQHFELDTDTVYCSDLKRAKESAKIISRILGDEFKIVEVPEFREMALGSWDGKFISEVKTEFPEEYARRGKDLLSFKIDDSAENFYDLYDRVIKKLNELIESTTGDIIIVSHSGVNRVIKCYMKGKDISYIKNMQFIRGTYEIMDLDEDDK